MGKPTGQMQELTQKYLDDYNLLYNWDYNEMCRFIENYSEEEFVEHYATYYRLCDDYGTELVDNFGLHFDLDASQFENFEDMYKVTLKQDKTLHFTMFMKWMKPQRIYQIG